MIARNAHYYCKEDLSLVENYDKAIADKDTSWDIHHRDEVKTLPSGIKVYRSREELIENDRYFDCPANELIFLTHKEHMQLHYKDKSISEDTKAKLSAKLKGRKFTDEHRTNMSKACKGRKYTDEQRANMSKARLGKYKGIPLSAKNRESKAIAQRNIGIAYQTYKANGGSMTYNEFRAANKRRK